VRRRPAPVGEALRHENERLRREVEQLRRQLSEQTEEIAEKKKQIADLERQLAGRKQNSTNSSKPPSSHGLAGEPRQRAGERRAGGRLAGSLDIAERIGRWLRRKESMRFGLSCRSNAGTAGILCPPRSCKRRPPAPSSGIRLLRFLPSKLGSSNISAIAWFVPSVARARAPRCRRK
jgi:hypothetical protein